MASFMTTGETVYRGLERVSELAYRSSVGDKRKIPLTCLFGFSASATEFPDRLEADFEGLLEEDFEECLEEGFAECLGEDLCECLEDGYDSDFEVFDFFWLDLD